MEGWKGGRALDSDWVAAQDDPAVNRTVALHAVFHIAWEMGRQRDFERARPTPHDDEDEDDDEYNDEDSDEDDESEEND